jgi:hypothetical protein
MRVTAHPRAVRTPTASVKSTGPRRAAGRRLPPHPPVALARASDPAHAVAERRRPVRVGGGRAGDPARAVAIRPGALAVGANVSGDPAAGVAERGLRRRCRGECEQDRRA